MKKTTSFTAASRWVLLILSMAVLPRAAQAAMSSQFHGRLMLTLSRVYSFMSPQQITVANALFSAQNPDQVELFRYVQENPHKGYADNRDRLKEIPFAQCTQARELTPLEYLHLTAKLQIFLREMSKANGPSKQIPPDFLFSLERLTLDISKTKLAAEELKIRFDKLTKEATPDDWADSPSFAVGGVPVPAAMTPTLQPLAEKYKTELKNIAPPLHADPKSQLTLAFARFHVDELKNLRFLANGDMLEAVKFLADKQDTGSIPRLERLFAEYSQWEFPSLEMINTQRHLMFATAASLLHLLTLEASKQSPADTPQSFLARTFSSGRLMNLGSDTVRTLTWFAVNRHMTDLAPTLLRQAMAHERPQQWRRGLSMDVLLDDLAYGAYLLATDTSQKEAALQMMVRKYNRLNDALERKPLALILGQIVDFDLAGDQAEKDRVTSLLNPERFSKDMELYQGLKEMSAMKKLWGSAVE